jgi:hypothetical protein
VRPPKLVASSSNSERPRARVEGFSHAEVFRCAQHDRRDGVMDSEVWGGREAVGRRKPSEGNRKLWPGDVWWCARRSLVCLVDESSTMLIARSTCSRPGGGASNRVRRSPVMQSGAPQRKRIRFGLVTSKLAMASLPQMVKPVTLPEATSVGRDGVVRGGREKHAAKDNPRNLGDPYGWVQAQLLCRMHKAWGVRSEVGRVYSSKEAGNDRGAKGRDCRSAIIKSRSSD